MFLSSYFQLLVYTKTYILKNSKVYKGVITTEL